MPLIYPVGFFKASAFSVAALTPAAWYDPSDLTTLFTTSGGSTNVTADGDPVGRMEDKSGNGYHLTQSSSSLRPLYKTSGGLCWLEFDGSNDALNGTATLSNIITATQYECMLAARYISLTTNDSTNLYLNTAVLTDTNARLGLGHGRSAGVVGGWHNIGGGSFAGAEKGSYSAGTDFVWGQRTTTGSIIGNYNGGSNITNGGNLDTTLTGTLVMGGYYAAANIRFYGLFARKTVLSTTDRASLVTYLGAKAGLTL